MRIVKDMLKGACIGVSNIIPGFSGGTMAVMLNIYDRLVCGIADIIHHPIKVIKDLIWILLGMLLGMVLAVFSIAFLLDKFPFPTVMFFVGLILGSIPSVFKDSFKSSSNKFNILWMVPAIVILVALAFVNGSDKHTSIKLVPLIVIFIMGIIASATMVIPGVSGSLTLMAFGYYTVVITDIKDIIGNILHLGSVSHEIIFILSFGVGCVIGLVLISKLIKWLLGKYRSQVYFFITGLLLASIFTIIYAVVKSDDYHITFSVGCIIWAILMTIVGTAIPLVMEHISNKFDKKDEENGKVE